MMRRLAGLAGTSIRTSGCADPSGPWSRWSRGQRGMGRTADPAGGRPLTGSRSCYWDSAVGALEGDLPRKLHSDFLWVRGSKARSGRQRLNPQP